MQIKLFMNFCIKNFIGTQGEVCRFKSPVVYATDHSKAVVPMFCFSVLLAL